jgi:hypothetical protein
MENKKDFNAREKKISNKIKTAGYFIKRLKDSGFVVFKMFNAYNNTDPRRWTVLVDPGVTSIYITCYTNKNEINEILFEIDDGGQLFNKGTYYKTDSVETIISNLIQKGVNNDAKKNPFSSLK